MYAVGIQLASDIFVLSVKGAVFFMSFIYLAIWIWFIIDCLLRDEFHYFRKYLWLALLLFVSFVGIIVYYYLEKEREQDEYRFLLAFFGLFVFLYWGFYYFSPF